MTYGSYDYPNGYDFLGWLMSFASIMWIPIFVIYKIATEKDADTFIGVSDMKNLIKKSV